MQEFPELPESAMNFMAPTNGEPSIDAALTAPKVEIQTAAELVKEWSEKSLSEIRLDSIYRAATLQKIGINQADFLRILDRLIDTVATNKTASNDVPGMIMSRVQETHLLPAVLRPAIKEGVALEIKKHHVDETTNRISTVLEKISNLKDGNEASLVTYRQLITDALNLGIISNDHLLVTIQTQLANIMNETAAAIEALNTVEYTRDKAKNSSENMKKKLEENLPSKDVRAEAGLTSLDFFATALADFAEKKIYAKRQRQTNRR